MGSRSARISRPSVRSLERRDEDHIPGTERRGVGSAGPGRRHTRLRRAGRSLPGQGVSPGHAHLAPRRRCRRGSAGSISFRLPRAQEFQGRVDFFNLALPRGNECRPDAVPPPSRGTHLARAESESERGRRAAGDSRLVRATSRGAAGFRDARGDERERAASARGPAHRVPAA